MLVIAHHNIEDPDIFWTYAKEASSSLPTGFKLHSVFPSKDMKIGTCVWEAPNVVDVQKYLDSVLGHVSKNMCYEVNEEAAVGLPKSKVDEMYSSY